MWCDRCLKSVETVVPKRVFLDYPDTCKFCEFFFCEDCHRSFPRSAYSGKKWLGGAFPYLSQHNLGETPSNWNYCAGCDRFFTAKLNACEKCILCGDCHSSVSTCANKRDEFGQYVQAGVMEKHIMSNEERKCKILIAGSAHESFDCDIPSDWSLLDLKRHVSRETAIPVAGQKYVIAGQVLQQDSTLFHLVWPWLMKKGYPEVSQDSKLSVHVFPTSCAAFEAHFPKAVFQKGEMPHDFEIVINTWNHCNRPFVVNQDMTIAELKIQVSEETGAPVDAFELLYIGRSLLASSSTLQDYNVVPGSRIDQVFSVRNVSQRTEGLRNSVRNFKDNFKKAKRNTMSGVSNIAASFRVRRNGLSSPK